MTGVTALALTAALAAACRGEGQGRTLPAERGAAPAASAAVRVASEARAAHSIAPVVLPLGYGTRAFNPEQIETDPDPKWQPGARVVPRDFPPGVWCQLGGGASLAPRPLPAIPVLTRGHPPAIDATFDAL